MEVVDQRMEAEPEEMEVVLLDKAAQMVVVEVGLKRQVEHEHLVTQIIWVVQVF